MIFCPGYTRFATIPNLLAQLPSPVATIDITATMKEHREKVFRRMRKTKELPVSMVNHDPAMGEFPKGMGMVERWVLRNVCAKKNREWWKFSTMGFDGVKRELRYADQERRFLDMGRKFE